MSLTRHMLAHVRAALAAGVLVGASFAIPRESQAQAGPPQTQPAARRARITGIVTDVETKAPLQGVNIFVVGTPITATTGPDGRYAIPSAPPGSAIIEAKRLGYAQKRVENVRLVADEVTTLNFTLAVSVTRLDQVTVTGTMDAVSVAKSTIGVDKITSENTPVAPTSSAAGMLEGKVAGVQINRASGRPGDGVYIEVRTPISGITQGGSTPSPLFVVDGVFLNQGQDITTQDIEALDVESIEVIKGAAAASLYGSRAAAGVIAITTKRGRGLSLGTNQFQVRTEAGFSNFVTTLNKNQHHQYLQDATGNWLDAAGSIVPREKRVVKGFGIMDQPFTSPTFNQAAQLFSPGRYNSEQVQVQGNSASTNYNLAYTRADDPGVLENNRGYLRHTLRLNVDARLSEKFTVGVSANHTRGAQDNSGPSFNNFYMIDTDVDLKKLAPFPSSNGFRYVIVPDSVTLYTNPLYSQYIADAMTYRSRTLLNANGVYRAFEWLSLSADASYDRGDNNTTSYTAKGTPLVTSTGGLSPSTGRLSTNNSGNNGWVFTGTASLSKRLGDLTVRLSQRGEARRELNQSLTVTGSDFVTQGLKAMSQAATKTTTNSQTDYRVIGGITNLGLSFKERYIGDFLLRREGNSLFGRAERWNSFGRASAAWLMSEESWFPLSDFNVFKLRYSWGVTGLNPGFSDQYEAMTSDGAGAIRRNAIGGTLGNVHVTPTFTTDQEIGLDMAYKSRISGTLTYNRNRSADVFVAVPAPATSGYAVQIANPATLAGRTLEATVQGAILSNPRGLRWDVLLTASRSTVITEKFGRTCYADNVTYLQFKCDGIPVTDMYGNMLMEDKSQLRKIHDTSLNQFDVNDEGYLVPVGTGNTYKDGVAKSLWGTNIVIDGMSYRWGMPMMRYTNADTLWYGKIGSAEPDVVYGLQNSFRYKDVRFYVQTTGQQGGDVYANSNQYYYNSGDAPIVDQYGKSDELKKPVAYYAAVAANNGPILKRFVDTGTYLTISEVLLGFTLDSKKLPVLSKMGMNRAQIDLIGRNLMTFTNYTGLNVRAGSPTLRFDNATYPMTRTFSGVVTLTF